MKTVYIIVEGPTEEEFVNNSIADHLRGYGIVNTLPILLETSPGFFGGDVSFSRYERNVQNLLSRDANAIVTSLIDYYKLHTDFPGYIHAHTLRVKNAQCDHLEQQLALTINNQRFIPYIQLHEFEGLLFSDTRGFDYIRNISPVNRTEIANIIAAFDNPEMIDDGEMTHPSKRLKRLIPKYKKPFHGPIIALENGMTPILQKCPRFNLWIDNLVAAASTP